MKRSPLVTPAEGVALQEPGGDSRVEIDTPTLITVSVLAWGFANVLHEIVGHAGAAWLLGIPVRAVSTTTLYVDSSAIESVTEERIINAAATPVNIVAGVLALVALRWLHVDNTPMRYFLWLSAVANFTMATWNMVTIPLLGAGDWSGIAEGLDNAAIWAVSVVAAGVAMAIAGFCLPLRLFLPDLRDHPGLRHKITFVPVAAMIVVQSLSVVPSPFATAPPEANHLLASVFAFAHLIVWAVLVNRGVGPRLSRPVNDVALERSNGWIVIGVLVGFAFITLLGPGLGPLEDDPRLAMTTRP